MNPVSNTKMLYREDLIISYAVILSLSLQRREKDQANRWLPAPADLMQWVFGPGLGQGWCACSKKSCRTVFQLGWGWGTAVVAYRRWEWGELDPNFKT